MEPAPRNPVNDFLRIAIVMVFLGFFAVYSGYRFVREWSALQPALALGATLWVLSGLTISGSAFWLLGRRTRPGTPLRIGGTAAILAGATLLAGVLARVVPCPGPTCVVSRLVSAAGLIIFGLLAFRATQRQAHGH